MPIQPGSPATQMPPDLGWIRQELDEIKRWQREALPSVRNSVAPVIEEVLAAQAALAEQQLRITALLNNVVIPATIGGANTQFPIAGTAAVVASGSVPIPAGYSQALVMVVGSVSCMNGSGGNLNIYARCRLASPAGVVNGTEGIQGVDSGKLVSLTVHSKTHYTGLNGGVLTADLIASTGGAATITNMTTADLDGIVQFMR